MGNEIVKYRNRLNQIPLRKFNTQEMNIFFTIASRFTEKGTKEIALSFSKLRKLSHFSDHGERFVQELNKLYDKLLAINAYTDDGHTISRFTAFNEYDIERDNKVVKISVNSKFKGLFNDLVDNFTRYSLEEFARIRSTYAKTMFRLIKQFRTTGHLEVKMSDFRNLLDIPKSYRVNTIDERVLTPIRIELTPHFSHFAYKKIRKKDRGGKVIGYKFTWKSERTSRNDFQDWENHYQDQLDNISQNQFLKDKEKEASKKLILNYYYKNRKYRKGYSQNVKQKENISKIGIGKKLYKTSNEKAKKALDDFKKKNN